MAHRFCGDLHIVTKVTAVTGPITAVQCRVSLDKSKRSGKPTILKKIDVTFSFDHSRPLVELADRAAGLAMLAIYERGRQGGKGINFDAMLRAATPDERLAPSLDAGLVGTWHPDLKSYDGPTHMIRRKP